MASAKHDISVLNNLIETTLDSAHGYEEGADNAQNPGFKSVFRRRGQERKQLVTELQNEVRRLGGKPEDEGSLLAAAHRGFLNLKNALTGSDESVIAEVERGEDYIKGKYETALEDSEISTEVRQVVTRVYERVKAGHDQARELKHATEHH